MDFNEPMRAALARVRDDAGLEFSVGQQEFRLRSSGADVVERKVELPTRWIRGMLEVQSYQAGMSRLFETSAVEALRFFRTLPKASTSKTPLWIARGPNGLFATTRPVDAAVRGHRFLASARASRSCCPSRVRSPCTPMTHNRPMPGWWTSARHD